MRPTSVEDDVLRDHLRAAAAGDAAAFARFYDATCRGAYTLELARAQRAPGSTRARRERADAATRARYLTAWQRAAEYADHHLSPRAWLLSLAVIGTGGPSHG